MQNSAIVDATSSLDPPSLRALAKRSIVFPWQKTLSATYVQKAEASELLARASASSQRAIESRLEQLSSQLLEQSRSRDSVERVRDASEAELRRCVVELKDDLQVGAVGKKLSDVSTSVLLIVWVWLIV